MRRFVVFVAACTHVPLSTQPSTLALHASELGAKGHASVEVEQGGTTRVDADDVVAVTIPGTAHHYLWGLVSTGTPDETRSLSIGSLVTGCPGDCLAEHAVGDVEVGTRRKLDPTRLGIGLFGAVATVASVACLAVCNHPGGGAYLGTGLALTTVIVPLSTVF